MTPSSNTSLNILCLATRFAGSEFIHECHSQGHRVFLLTKEKALSEDWPREDLEELLALPNDAGTNLVIEAASHIARHQKLDRIVALHEFDVLNGAILREHLFIPGMTITQVRNFRDKLAMRVAARQAGVPVPEFVHVLNYDKVRRFVTTIPPPWMLKPRSNASGIGIKKLTTTDQVFESIKDLEERELLHERPSHHLLESYVKGEVFHVDSLLFDGKILFTSISRYGRPPFDIYHHGGIYTSVIVEHGSNDEKTLLEFNQNVIIGLGLKNGVAHAEFIKSAVNGKFSFLEIASRVGGAHISDAVEAAYNLNLWREWVRIETATEGQPFILPPTVNDYAGVILSLARQEWPDTSEFDDPEIYLRVRKKFHIGFVVRSTSYHRILDLLAEYEERIREDYSAVAPPVERPEEL